MFLQLVKFQKPNNYRISSPISRAIFSVFDTKVWKIFFIRSGVRLMSEGLGFKNKYKFNVNAK